MTDRAPRPYGQRGQITIGSGYKDGARVCRWCESPIPKGSQRRTWCSRECVEEWRERGDWNHIRDKIQKRDKVCRICGSQRYHKGPLRNADPRYPDYAPTSMLRSGWDVDHIVAVAEGGTDDPENLRLLCSACHKDVTRIQRKLKALRRTFAILLRSEKSAGSDATGARSSV